MSVTIDPTDIEALETAAEALIRAQGVSEASVRLLALALRFRAETGLQAPAPDNVIQLRKEAARGS